MDLVTVGKETDGYRMSMYYSPEEGISPVKGLNIRYRMALIEEGFGFLKLGKSRSLIVAPALCCFNEKDLPELENESNMKAKVIYFHPGVINNRFEFGKMTYDIEEMSYSDSQDKWCLRPFIQRSDEYSGVITIEQPVKKRIAELLNCIGEELELQKDNFWPCRSRSYLLELMFLVNRVYDQPRVNNEIALNESSAETDKVIMYLHINYHDKLTLSSLSNIFHTNKTTLNLNFKKATGLPVMTYLNVLRIKNACSMLRNTMLNVTEILTRVGFNDDTHFGRAFRKYTGCTPSEYRQDNCWLLK